MRFFSRSAVVTALALCLGPCVGLHAEPPSWEEIQDAPILMRHHFVPLADYGSYGTAYSPSDGIWQLKHEPNEIQQNRPFFASSIAVGATGSFFNGNQGFLVVKGDRVLFQAYPYDIHFDPLSWRMINRLPAEGGRMTGWALQGPYLDANELGSTGLQPGVHGIARCEIDIITNGSWVSASCAPMTVPADSAPRTTTQERIMLWSPGSPAASVVETTPLFDFQDTSWDGDRVLLSFDPERGGFWRGTELHAQFYPVRDGELQTPTFDLDLDALPFGLEPENGYLSALHYHPPDGRLYGVLYRRPYSSTNRGSLTFSLDPATGEATELAGIYDDDFPAFTFASFGEAPSVFEQIIPIVADATGRRGARWRTDLWLFNPSNEATSVAIARQNRPEDSVEIELPGHGSIRLEDVLAELGGGADGDGVEHDVLFLTSPHRWAEQVAAVGRIWTLDPDTGGSFGHAVPAVPAPYGYSNHSVRDFRTIYPEDPAFNIGANAFVAHVDLDMREPGRYRHNLGIVNPHDKEISIELFWTYHDVNPLFDEMEPDERRMMITVPANEMRLISLERSFPADVVEGWAPRIGVFGADPAIIWLSMVDNRTDDATFVPYTSFPATTALQNTTGNMGALRDYYLAIPAVAATSGREGSHWRTDLYGYLDDHDADTLIVATIYPLNETSCGGTSQRNGIYQRVSASLAMPPERWEETLGYPPGGAPSSWMRAFRTIYPDVVRLFDECAGEGSIKGGLELLAGSWFSGYSRTYTTRPDGGTYGGMLPLYPHGGWPVQHFAGIEVREEGRINIGFYNGKQEHAVVHRVTLFDEDGQQVAQRHLTLEPHASVQRDLAAFFNLDGIPPGTYGLTVLPLDDPVTGVQGRSWAYVSVIDNRTNDPINLW